MWVTKSENQGKMTDSTDREHRLNLEIDTSLAADRARSPGKTSYVDATTLRASPVDPSDGARELELVVTEGPDAGARCFLSSSHPSPRLLGQSATCDFRLTDRSISRRHASVDASTWPVRVRDLGSTNGTFVNGVAIVEAHLAGGETLRLGSTTMVAEPRAAGPRAKLAERSRFGRTLGRSEAMRRLYPLCDRLAASAESVLIEGEPGTGKELLAESLHEVGPRAGAPFVVVDCTLGAANLARRQRETGDAFERLVAQAGSGTLLFDEIGELDAPLQRALSRALAAPGMAARVLVTTRKNLDLLVQHGRFRDDLYAQISAVRFELPPLRARQEDVPSLARHFWIEGGGAEAAFPADAVARAETQPWTGNVRELREFVSNLLTPGADAGAPSSSSTRAAAPVGRVSPQAAELAAVVEELLQADVSYSGARRRLLVEFEQRYVERMLAAHNGNITRAAAASGLARRNFQLIRARRRDEA
jgi:two-component system, NtrC family, response regulator HydG